MWSKFRECSASCGGGVKERTRECDNPLPQHGGKTCVEQELGPAMEEASCNTQPCPSKFLYNCTPNFSSLTCIYATAIYVLFSSQILNGTLYRFIVW